MTQRSDLPDVMDKGPYLQSEAFGTHVGITSEAGGFSRICGDTRNVRSTIARERIPLEKPMAASSSESDTLLTPSEVAALFRVDPKTVTRWAKSGKLSSIRTLGGHRRYHEVEVRDLLNGVPAQRLTD